MTQAPPSAAAAAPRPGAASPSDDLDELTAETTARLATRSRRLLRDLLRPHRRALKLLMIAVVIENAARLSIPLLVAKGIDVGIPPIQQDDNLQPLFVIVGFVLLATIIQAISRNIFLVRSGTDRPEHPLRDPAAAVPPLPATEPGVPRLLHVRPGDLPPDLRRRRHLRDARDRVRRADHRGPDPRRHRRCCCSSSTSAWAWSRCCAVRSWRGRPTGSARSRRRATG